MKHWVIVAEVCGDCGGRQAVQVLDHRPTPEEEGAVRKALGGAFCIGMHIYETEPGEIVTWRSDD